MFPQDLANLRFAIAMMSSGRPDRGYFSVPCPSGDGLRVDSKDRRDLCRRKQAVPGANGLPRSVGRRQGTWGTGGVRTSA
jgi:hypothetical protein